MKTISMETGFLFSHPDWYHKGRTGTWENILILTEQSKRYYSPLPFSIEFLLESDSSVASRKQVPVLSTANTGPWVGQFIIRQSRMASASSCMLKSWNGGTIKPRSLLTSEEVCPLQVSYRLPKPICSASWRCFQVEGLMSVRTIYFLSLYQIKTCVHRSSTSSLIVWRQRGMWLSVLQALVSYYSLHREKSCEERSCNRLCNGGKANKSDGPLVKMRTQPDA